MLRVLAATALVNAAIVTANLQGQPVDFMGGSGSGSGGGGGGGGGKGSCQGSGGSTKCEFKPGGSGPHATGAQILGKSGKVMLYRAGKGPSSDDAIKFSVDSLWEILSDGKKAGSGKDKHGFNNFAKVDFAPSNFESVSYGGADGPRAKQFNLTVDISAVSSQLRTQFNFFEESGSIANEGEVIKVRNGSTKINIQLDGWQWCTSSMFGPPCHGKNGEYVDISFGVMSKEPSDKPKPPPPDSSGPPPSGKPKPKRKPEQLSLGGNASMVLSTLIQVDGVWKNMTDGFPKIKSTPGGVMVTIRAPKFMTGIVYDPVMEYGDDDGEDDNDAGVSSTLSIPAAFAAALCVFAPRAAARWA